MTCMECFGQSMGRFRDMFTENVQENPWCLEMNMAMTSWMVKGSIEAWLFGIAGANVL